MYLSYFFEGQLSEKNIKKNKFFHVIIIADRCDIPVTEILLKVALNTINNPPLLSLLTDEQG
jgi:hypothetical protein